MGINNVPDAAPWLNTHFVLPYGLRLQQKVGMSTITNVVDAGATVVYTANNDYSAGNIVSIYDVNPVAYNLQSATILSATSTTFTITSAATGTYVSGGTAQRTGAITVSIPTGITFVYAIAVGGGANGSSGGSGAGGISWGWTLVNSNCFIGSQNSYTRFGNVIAGNGGILSTTPGLGGGGGSGSTGINTSTGGTNYWGIIGGPGGSNTSTTSTVNGNNSVAGGGGGYIAVAGTAGNGGNGISGGGGGGNLSGTGTCLGGNGGSGFAGGGGGRATNSTGSRTGGNGGTGIDILTGANYTGGTGTTGTSANGGGGGGAGVAGNGSNAITTTGGLGGLGGGGGGGGNTGGAGGAGVLYLFY